MVPDVWVGRDREQADFEGYLATRAAGRYARGRVVLGDAGTGKSVLVNRFADQVRDDGSQVTSAVRVASGSSAVGLLAEALRALAGPLGRAGTWLDRLETLSVLGVGASWRAPEPDPNAYRAVATALVELARAARSADRVLLVRVDEAQNAAGDDLSKLLTVLGDALEHVEHAGPDGRGDEHLPLLVYLSGLPDLMGRAERVGATFGRRFRPLELSVFEPAEMRVALAPFLRPGWEVLADDGPVRIRMTPDAADSLVARCWGDPFLFQLVGHAAWLAGTTELIGADDVERGWISEVVVEVRAYVRAKVAGLTDAQREYLFAAAELQDADRTPAAVARQLGLDAAAQVSSTRAALRRYFVADGDSAMSFRSPALQAWLRGELG